MIARSNKPKARRGTSSEQGTSAGPAGLAKAGSVAIVPALDDVPATRGMVYAVRTELLRRMDGVQHKLEGDIQSAQFNLRTEMQEMRTELRTEMQEMRTELRAEMQELRTDVHTIKVDMSNLKGDMARMVSLMEEQNSRNKVVLDGLSMVIARQDRTDVRLDAVEATVRSLAAARPPSTST